jgi:hypothetical protein
MSIGHKVRCSLAAAAAFGLAACHAPAQEPAPSPDARVSAPVAVSHMKLYTVHDPRFTCRVLTTLREDNSISCVFEGAAQTPLKDETIDIDGVRGLRVIPDDKGACFTAVPMTPYYYIIGGLSCPRFGIP